jgi:hypothetical protein
LGQVGGAKDCRRRTPEATRLRALSRPKCFCDALALFLLQQQINSNSQLQCLMTDKLGMISQPRKLTQKLCTLRQL